VTVVILMREGNENPGIKQLWAHAPSKEGPEVKPEGVNFNPANLLPREMKFFHYEGSLPTAVQREHDVLRAQGANQHLA